MSNNLAVVILAAGEGTRMKSEKPKALHLLCGKPLISWVLSSVEKLKPTKTVVVIGHKGTELKAELSGKKIEVVEQKTQLGSADAFKTARSKLSNFPGNIIVICVDTPLISAETLKALFRNHLISQNDATILSSRVDNPFGYGRILRTAGGEVIGIVEEKASSDEQKKTKEINSGVYCFKSPLIWQIVSKVRNENKKKEYYLTDVISILRNLRYKVGAHCIINSVEIMGVNSRLELSGLEKIARKDILTRLMLGGVTVVDPDSTYISPDVSLGQDTIIYPGTTVEGKTKVGRNCSIGPNSFIKDTTIGDEVQIRSSYAVGAVINDRVKVGPFANLRPGTVLKSDSRVGNFTEIKNSYVGEGSKVSHLSYIGDAQLGRKVNVGAGTITCNYDGKAKNKTIIGDRAFVGSNVNLVAPVRIGSDVMLGAGSTITEDVPSKTLAIARARQIHKKRK